MPQVSRLYKDKALTQVSIKYTNGENNFYAMELAPALEVDQKTGIYYQYDRSNLKKPASTKTTGRAASPETEFNLTEVAYGPLTRRRLKQFIEEDEFIHANAPLNPEIDATENVTEQVYLEREIDLAADMVNVAIVTQNVTLSGTGQWSDYTNSKPIVAVKGYITAMKLAGLIAPNVMAMGQQVWDQLSEHPTIVDRIKFTSSATAAYDIVARLFTIERLIVMDTVYDTAAEGLTSSNNFVWGKHAWLMKIAKNPGLKTVSAIYHLVLKGARRIDKWKTVDPDGMYIRVSDYYDRKLMAAEGIYGIFNAVA